MMGVRGRGFTLRRGEKGVRGAGVRARSQVNTIYILHEYCQSVLHTSTENARTSRKNPCIIQWKEKREELGRADRERSCGKSWEG